MARLYEPANLLAWCVAAFDAKERNPEQRMQMLKRLGIARLAYDWREKHIPFFDLEIETAKAHGIVIQAWWFPWCLNDEGRKILDAIGRGRIFPQIWISGGGEPVPSGPAQEQRIEEEMERLRPVVQEASRMGLQVGLYNHGGWFGEPENQIAILERFKQEGYSNLGLIYNLHHGHAHLDRFDEMLQMMKPYLLAFNLNGMVRNGEESGQKILPLGEGNLDLDLLRSLAASGWSGPVGILNHDSTEDAETRLAANLSGLRRLAAQLEGV